LELSMPTIPVASEGKKGMCFCLWGDAIVNFCLLVGRVAVVQAEIAPVRSVPVLCSTGSFGHNLVVMVLKKLHIVIVIDVKVTFQTLLPLGNQNHTVGCSSLMNGSHFSLDGRLHTASMPVELCTAMLRELSVPIATLFLGTVKIYRLSQKYISCQFVMGRIPLGELDNSKDGIVNGLGDHFLRFLERVTIFVRTGRFAAFVGS